jgi:hypothetical protein
MDSCEVWTGCFVLLFAASREPPWICSRRVETPSSSGCRSVPCFDQGSIPFWAIPLPALSSRPGSTESCSVCSSCAVEASVEHPFECVRASRSATEVPWTASLDALVSVSVKSWLSGFAAAAFCGSEPPVTGLGEIRTPITLHALGQRMATMTDHAWIYKQLIADEIEIVLVSKPRFPKQTRQGLPYSLGKLCPMAVGVPSSQKNLGKKNGLRLLYRRPEKFENSRVSVSPQARGKNVIETLLLDLSLVELPVISPLN